jgi:ubiquinone/menaquinone biosynthesis C-methylase UbiE
VTWEPEAPNWIAWARKPGFDSYWRFHRNELLPTLTSPGRLTLDIGCGEGRVSRDLASLGHRVIGVDPSPTMLAAAREADPEGEYVEADAAKLPFEAGVADVALAFMSLMDMDDMRGATAEIARVLEPGGAFVATVVHPLNSATLPRDEDTDRFRIQAYRAPHPYTDSIEREGLQMTFRSFHYSLEDYWRAIRDAGFLVEDLREIYDDVHPLWREVPLFLRFDARKPR